MKRSLTTSPAFLPTPPLHCSLSWSRPDKSLAPLATCAAAIRNEYNIIHQFVTGTDSHKCQPSAVQALQFNLYTFQLLFFTFL